jgi:hypothetical protein
VETGDWGSNEQFACYPLMVEGKVARVAECRMGKNGEGKNEMEGHRMMSAGKEYYE